MVWISEYFPEPKYLRGNVKVELVEKVEKIEFV